MVINGNENSEKVAKKNKCIKCDYISCHKYGAKNII